VSTTEPERSGYVEVDGGRVWWRLDGSEHADRAPVVAIAGGPGCPHQFMWPFHALADERPVVLYDQLDTGRSDRPEDPANWRIGRFVDEVDRLVRHLDLDRVVLVGHSWGTIVAMEAALAGVEGVAALVLASPIASVARWAADGAELVLGLSAEAQEAIRRADESGTYDTPEFEAASREYGRRHTLLTDPRPDYILEGAAAFGEALYVAVNGPSEFTVRGSLAGYQCEDRLPEIAVPTLITCGDLDGARPDTCRHYASLMPDAEVAVFPGASHFTFVEQPEEYLAVVRRFLAGHGL
jgi:proline-specific peptidase